MLGAAFAAAQAPEGPMVPRPGVEAQQAPKPIRVRTVLVDAPVTVRDANGKMVHHLQESEFKLTDNGVEQKITHFDLGSAPISLVVVVERSSRIEPILPELRRTGIVITQTVMGPSGEGAVIAVDDTVETLQKFTKDSDAIEMAMRKLKEGGEGLKLYDAMNAGVEMLSDRPTGSETEPAHRRVLLVLAQSDDHGSEITLGEMLRKAQLQNVTIYQVGLSKTRAALQKKPNPTPPPSATPEGTFGQPPVPGIVQTPTTEAMRNGTSLGGGGVDPLALAIWALVHATESIKHGGVAAAAVSTGGDHLSTWKDRSIEEAIDEVGGELHSQYVLSYTPTGTDESGYHEIKVEIDRKDLKVRARPGYYLAAPGS